MPGMQLTAIIPVSQPGERNRYLEKWLSSLPHNIQVILVHDQSLENECESTCPLSKFAQFAQIEILCSPFGNPGDARNYALDYGHLEGEYLTFWDSDDLPMTKNVSELLNSNLSVDVIVGRYTKYHLKSGQRIETSEPMGLFSMVVGIGLWRMVIRRQFVEKLRFQSLLLGEDQLYFLDLLKMKPNIIFVDFLLYEYLVHEHSLIKSAEKNLSQLSLVLNSRPRETTFVSRVLRAKLELSILKKGLWFHKGNRSVLYFRGSKDWVALSAAISLIVIMKIMQLVGYGTTKTGPK